jgi:hypothetical protein
MTEYRKEEIEEELQAMLREATDRGEDSVVIISNDLHKRVARGGDNRMPMACNAMWDLWEKQGKNENKIIHTTPSDKSSTIEIEFNTIKN